MYVLNTCTTALKTSKTSPYNGGKGRHNVNKYNIIKSLLIINKLLSLHKF